MNKLEEVKDSLASIEKSAETYLRFVAWAKAHFLPIVAEASESVTYDLTCALPYIHVYTREDLAVFLKLGGVWTKEKQGKTLVYYATVSDFFFRIYAHDSALPPTCKVVKETRMVEAVPAHEEVVETVVCELPSESIE